MARKSIPSVAGPVYKWGLASFRRLFRSSEAALVLLGVTAGLAAALLMIAQRAIAHGMQALIYGFSGASLSAAPSIDRVRLIALPIVGLLLGFGSASGRATLSIQRHSEELTMVVKRVTG